MWNPLRTEIADRFAAVESFFKETRDFKGVPGQTARGLAFVQVYAAYEYTVRTVMRTAVDAIKLHKPRTQDLLPSLMAVFLDSELKALKDCSPARIWKKRIELFKSLFSAAPANADNTVFPHDGSHFRHEQLQMIFDVLGIKRTPAQRRRHLFRIDEVVDYRNEIAHGRVTPDKVGQRYTREEIWRIIKQVKSVCLLLVSATEKHCSQPSRHRRGT